MNIYTYAFPPKLLFKKKNVLNNGKIEKLIERLTVSLKIYVRSAMQERRIGAKQTNRKS